MRNMFSSRSWSTEMVGALLAVAFSGIAGCTAPAPEDPASDLSKDPSAVSGELVTYVADFDDGHSERWQALRQPDGNELRLNFDAAPPFTTGHKLWVRGDMVADTVMHVTAFDGGPEPVRSGALSADPPETIPIAASETYAIVLVDLGAGPPGTAAAAQLRLNSATPSDRSFANYYSESSYGKYNVDPTSTTFSTTFSMTTCDTSGMSKAIEAAMPQVAAFQHIIYYFPRTTLCNF